jgi:hypothetical protein
MQRCASSGNPACKICVHPTISSSDYKCTNETYHSDPYSCEAGDLGGIYGSFDVGDDQWLNINLTDRHA